jgi:hypothetical protein
MPIFFPSEHGDGRRRKTRGTRRRRKRGRAEERRCPGRGKRVCTTWLFSLTRKSRSISTERFATAMPHFTERACARNNTEKDNPFPHFCRDSYRKVSEIFCIAKFMRIHRMSRCGCSRKSTGLKGTVDVFL